MTVRVEVVTPCEHGEITHWLYDTVRPGTHERCDPTRTVFTEWPPEAIEAAADALIRRQFPKAPRRIQDKIVATYSDRQPFVEDAEAVLAAAWGHITGDNK